MADAATRAYNRRYYQATRERQRVAALYSHHGLRPEGWAALWAEQDGRCWLCRRPLPEEPSKVDIDHDHRCCPRDFSCARCRRGLAHHPCNVVAGMAGDDPELLRVIAENLAEGLRRVCPPFPEHPALFDAEATP